MPMVNLYFPVLGTTLPMDHGYTVYATLARALPTLHQPDSPVLIGPVHGTFTGDGMLHLDPRRSYLRFRLPAEHIVRVLPLAGKSLEILGHRIRIGVPRVLSIVPAPNLIARMVTMKKSSRQDHSRIRDYMDPSAFLDGVCRDLQRQGIKGEPAIPLVRSGPYQGKPRRHVLRIKEQKVVGFGLQVTGLTAEESVRLQETGIGGRKRMGCGFFVPVHGGVAVSRPVC